MILKHCRCHKNTFTLITNCTLITKSIQLHDIAHRTTTTQHRADDRPLLSVTISCSECRTATVHASSVFRKVRRLKQWGDSSTRKRTLRFRYPRRWRHWHTHTRKLNFQAYPSTLWNITPLTLNSVDKSLPEIIRFARKQHGEQTGLGIWTFLTEGHKKPALFCVSSRKRSNPCERSSPSLKQIVIKVQFNVIVPHQSRFSKTTSQQVFTKIQKEFLYPVQAICPVSRKCLYLTTLINTSSTHSL